MHRFRNPPETTWSKIPAFAIGIAKWFSSFRLLYQVHQGEPALFTSVFSVRSFSTFPNAKDYILWHHCMIFLVHFADLEHLCKSPIMEFGYIQGAVVEMLWKLILVNQIHLLVCNKSREIYKIDPTNLISAESSLKCHAIK